MKNNIFLGSDWKRYVLELKNEAKRRKISQKQISEITDIDPTNISRFFCLKTLSRTRFIFEDSRLLGR